MSMKITNKGLYWGLILTFGILYVLVAFVSTLHAIDFFKLSNVTSLAILLGVAYEIGQASVLFSILMTKNKEKYLPWMLMFLLTALQVTANVFASYKHMALNQNQEWTFWYTSILKVFGVTGGNPETYQVIISWISGALLPMVALGMTALVAQNIKLISEGETLNEIQDEPVDAKDIIAEVSRVRPSEDDLKWAESILYRKQPIVPKDSVSQEISKIANDNIHVKVSTPEVENENIPDISNEEIETHLDDRDDSNEFKSHLDEEASRLIPESEPEMIPTEVQTEKPVRVDIKNNNGLIDVELSPKVEEPKVEEPKVEEISPPIETEEQRLDRLRKIARENLKKK